MLALPPGAAAQGHGSAVELSGQQSDSVQAGLERLKQSPLASNKPILCIHFSYKWHTGRRGQGVIITGRTPALCGEKKTKADGKKPEPEKET